MVQAPFELITLETNLRTGQASGVKWYVAALRLWKRRVYSNNRVITQVTFGLDRSNPQYVGVMNQQNWRKA